MLRGHQVLRPEFPESTYQNFRNPQPDDGRMRPPCGAAAMHLNPTYTFDRYLPSAPRAVAPTLCRALAARVSSRHRCLFLHGPPGSGKTHLLHAVGHATRQDNASARVVIVSCADLVVDLIEDLRRGLVPEIRSTFARANVLLVDNLEVIVDRPATQTEIARALVACLTNGGVVAGAATCRPRSLRELTAQIPAALGPRNLVVKRASRAQARRILLQEAESWGLNPPDRTVDRMARQSGGDARTALGMFSRWHLEQKLSAGAIARPGGSATTCTL